MQRNIQGYEVSTSTATRPFIQIIAERGRYQTAKAAFGVKAKQAIAKLERLEAAGDKEKLRLWLCLKSCNGF